MELTNMENIFVKCFCKFTDPRVETNKKHLLMDIISLTLFAIMSGAQTFDEIEEFGLDHEEWLKKYLQLPNGIPSHDIINRSLSLLDPEQLQKSFINWINHIKNYINKNFISIDGKTMKASHQNSKVLKSLPVLIASSCSKGLTLGQMKVDGKTNEITFIPNLLEQLAIEGAIITIDAMGCQKDIASSIVEKKADYILALKGNQKELKEIFKIADELDAKSYTYDGTGSHGGREIRIATSLPIHTIETQLDLKKWANVQSVVKVTCTTEKTAEDRYFISTLSYQEVEIIGLSIRSHRKIENNLHWVLDVAFVKDEWRIKYGRAALNFECFSEEDILRIRSERAALSFEWFRKMALELLDKDGTTLSNKRKMLRNCINPEHIIKGLLSNDKI